MASRAQWRFGIFAVGLTEYGKQKTEYRIQNTGYRIQDTGYRIQDTDYKIQNRIHNVLISNQQNSIVNST